MNTQKNKVDPKKAVKVKQPTALKRDRQNAKRALRNRSFRSTLKTAVKTLESTPKDNTDSKKTALSQVFSFMDKAVKRGVYKPNKANRLKSRMALKMNAAKKSA